MMRSLDGKWHLALVILGASVLGLGLGCGSRKAETTAATTGTGGGGSGLGGNSGTGGGTGGHDVGDGSAGADGATSSLDAGANDGAAPSDATRCPGASAQPARRPQSVACSATDVSLFNLPDAGAIACATNAECVAANGIGWTCHQGRCSLDQCLTDTDCASGMACGCAAEFHGNAFHTNACVSSQCRVDSDCGQGGACSPSYSGYCGSLTGYYCHSPADTCAANADCNCDPARPLCRYQATLGHWSCQAIIICNG